MTGAGTIIGFTLLAAFAARVAYLCLKPLDDGPDEMADPHGDTFPARLLPARHTCRGGIPFAAPAFIPDEIEDDQFVTVYCDGHWEWDAPVHGRTIGDD